MTGDPTPQPRQTPPHAPLDNPIWTALTTTQRHLARGDTPFLHAYADNAGAIGLYERLGYRWRAYIHITVLAPA